MKTLPRWWRFNVVGVMGAVVQMGVLALLRRGFAGHIVWATAMAVEAAILHNFVWHRHITWRERSDAWGWQLARFHAANGMVSLLGNVMLTWLLVTEMKMPVLAANGVAIVACSITNFWLGNTWVFPKTWKEARLS
jgi:putative flippase GtrA